MNVSREEKEAEAVRRMELLGIYRPTILQFKEQGVVSISEPPYGAFYWMEDKQEAEAVQAFEKRYNALVYMIVRSFTDIGKMDAYMYVSDHPNEWALDIEALKRGEALVFVQNWAWPDCSELGCIGIEKTIGAGLLRTW